MTTQLCFLVFLMPFYLILFQNNSILVSAGHCQSMEQSVLVRLKNELRFNSSWSTKLVLWNTNGTECCTWEGVTCNIWGQVNGLDLSNESISGGIDENTSLFSMENLENLNLAQNLFRHTQIPSGFGRLTSLKSLNLSEGFSDQIPEDLSWLTRLEVLDLSSIFDHVTELDEPGPLTLQKPSLSMVFRNLTFLRELYLDGVKISSQNSDWCQTLSSSLPRLEVLSLSGCELSGPLDESLQKLKSLSVINLNRNNLSSPVPGFFVNFRNLTVLKLADCNLHGTFPEKILQMLSLEILFLSGNTNLTGSLPYFPINGSLQTLVLSFTKFTGGIPKSIGNLKKLSRIDLSWSNFSGRIPKSMGNLTLLSYLDLSSNKFTSQIPSFQSSKNLTYINLSRNNLSGSIPSSHFHDLHNLVSVDLRLNSFDGRIPFSLFSLQRVEKILLSNNNFDGPLANFTDASSSLLDTLDLSSNKLEGEIPRSFFGLKQLSILLLSSNNLSGMLHTKDLRSLRKLSTLDLSFNTLSIETSSIVIDLIMLSILKLASCNLQQFPNLANQRILEHLDLSDNKIGGAIPSWIWRVGNGRLSHLNLSHNLLTGIQTPYMYSDLVVLDLHSNRLSGVIPIPPKRAAYIDFSNNLFKSSLLESVGESLQYAYFFLVSRNLLFGAIPESICKAGYLKILDLSNNNLTGRIPRCLIGFHGDLEVMNLGNNSLSGRIEGIFPKRCGLRSLDLHGNYFEGEVPRSLVNCTMLEELFIGNNKINDTYPCFLGDNNNMRVLVLRSNRFHGSMSCNGSQQNGWSELQILDIARNNFTGVIPVDYFQKWDAMSSDKNGARNNYLGLQAFSLKALYHNTVIVTIKGLELELVKIMTIFTFVDISSNQFFGEIPSTIGQLKALYLLNVSHNEFTGSIPPSLGNLSHLESLDMSSNKLTGKIPEVLTNLSFLSSFNLSDNHLEGRIPTGSQFQTFLETSYRGNKGLCGSPLNKSCYGTVVSTHSSVSSSGASSMEQEWQAILYGMGVGAGLFTVISILRSLRRRRISRQTNLSR